jgi:hypothetical protein
MVYDGTAVFVKQKGKVAVWGESGKDMTMNEPLVLVKMG